MEERVPLTIRELVEEAHKHALEKGFYDNVERSNPKEIPVRLALIHAEVSEALEAHRKGKTLEFYEELADIVIRTADLAGFLDVDLEMEVARKMMINEGRSYRHGGKLY